MLTFFNLGGIKCYTWLFSMLMMSDYSFFKSQFVGVERQFKGCRY